MKDVLIASFDMEIGGVERSLLSMLDSFDYDNNNVDLMLYSHTGDFMNLISNKVNLLEENKKYSTFRKSIGQTFKDKQFLLGLTRLMARNNCTKIANKFNLSESSYVQMQLMWKYAINFLPNLDKEYDLAISYLWPHYFVAEKVNAKKKVAWIHTDYSKLDTYIDEDLKIWDKYDCIFAVSEECKNSFLNKYGSLKNKVKVLENITAVNFIKNMAKEEINDFYTKEGEFNLLSVARFSPAKGIDNAVRALKILHDRGLTNIKWNVVGYGGDEENIRKLIKENNLNDSFILLGKKTNPYPYMKKCDLYVQPSRYEGKAVTVTEAQILSKPVLITNYPTAKSQIRNGIDGYICELGPRGIADGIEELYINTNTRKGFSNTCININFENGSELEKIYKLMNN
ncbi:glycosyltransferase [Clostridium sp. D53t1_180928_C8]|uniref:glycosyltransferase n=1 Tax=Clostridium sp. D53t1_180928_C8 TaxID=2787101 RepID=UPI0018AAC919|nr:glycosyltransferase [Clostridium sp. D53t1_180928_C8]